MVQDQWQSRYPQASTSVRVNLGMGQRLGQFCMLCSYTITRANGAETEPGDQPKLRQDCRCSNGGGLARANVMPDLIKKWVASRCHRCL